MKTWAHFTGAFALGIACGTNIAEPSRTEFEQSLIGREWIQGYQPYEQCKPLGGYVLQRDDSFGVNSFKCDLRKLELFIKYITDYPKNNKVRVIDALLLPKLKPGEQFLEPGECELSGKTDMDFIVLARLGRRDKITWKNGVRAAWRPNPETGKFEELSTKNIVCWRPTPP